MDNENSWITGLFIVAGLFIAAIGVVGRYLCLEPLLDKLRGDAQSQNAKTGQESGRRSFETPQQSNSNVESVSTAASLDRVQIDDLEQGVEDAAAPQSAASDMGAILALETPQQPNSSLESPSTAANRGSVQIDGLEQGAVDAAAPQSSASDMGAILALETPQQPNSNLESASTAANFESVQIDGLEQGVEDAAAPQSSASDMGAIVALETPQQPNSNLESPSTAARRGSVQIDGLEQGAEDAAAPQSAASMGAIVALETPLTWALPATWMQSWLATDPAWAAISLEQLNAVREKAKVLLGAKYAEATMYLINQLLIQPACEVEQKSYAHIVNAGALLHVEVFVSHAWAENFDEFVNSVNKAFHLCPVKPNLWICAFALVQSSNPKVIQSQVGLNEDPSAAPFTRALRKAEKVLVVRNRAVDLYGRIWCCWELAAAAEHGFLKRSGALMVAGPATFSKKKVDVAHAEASNEDDKVRILRHILVKGSYGDVNKMLTQVQNHVAEIA